MEIRHKQTNQGWKESQEKVNVFSCQEWIEITGGVVTVYQDRGATNNTKGLELWFCRFFFVALYP